MSEYLYIISTLVAHLPLFSFQLPTRAMTLMTEMFGSQNVQWSKDLATDIILINVDGHDATLDARTLVGVAALRMYVCVMIYHQYCFNVQEVNCDEESLSHLILSSVKKLQSTLQSL